MTPLVGITDLNKRYGKIQALDMANMAIEEGTIHGLFGANGAGKSTMIRIIMGITEPDSGMIELKGLDVIKRPVEARNYCTPVVEIPFLYKYMRLYDLLHFYCEISGIENEEIDDRIEEALHMTGTGGIIEKRFDKMSLGQQHRTEVARAIATANDILLMDEPFIGIDIETKRRLKIHFRKWVKAKPGRAILFTSHNLMENEGFVDVLTFLLNGRTMETGSVEHFKSKYLKPTFRFQLDNLEGGIVVIQTLPDVKIERFENDTVWVSLKKEDQVKTIIKSLSLKDIGVMNFDREGSVEDVFGSLMGVQK